VCVGGGRGGGRGQKRVRLGADLGGLTGHIMWAGLARCPMASVPPCLYFYGQALSPSPGGPLCVCARVCVCVCVCVSRARSEYVGCLGAERGRRQGSLRAVRSSWFRCVLGRAHSLQYSALLSAPLTRCRRTLSSHCLPVAPRTGKISFEDFGTVVRAVGLNPSEKELEGAGSGEKDLGAVQAFVKQLDESKPSKSDVESKVSRPPACVPPRPLHTHTHTPPLHARTQASAAAVQGGVSLRCPVP
jgi:hypothetical protein